jgi:hypothetical protein
MGDRAQVAIQPEGAFLYTHWAGFELLDVIHTALSRKQRWSDPEYLARIVFCEMVKGREDEETGYGIGTSEHRDLGYPLITIDTHLLEIRIGGKRVSFEHFLDNPQSLKEAYNV